MTQPNSYRDTQRLDKNQAFLILFLLLAVALVSFTLGVMVGRVGNSNEGYRVEKKVARIHPVLPAQSQSRVLPVKQEPAEKETFSYRETLPKRESPVGSGINLPPAVVEKTPLRKDDSVVPPKAFLLTKKDKDKEKEKTVPPVIEKMKPVVEKETEAAIPKQAAAAGTYGIQVGSFRKIAAANSVQKKLVAGGYRTVVKKVEIPSSGTWYRVIVGFYDNREAAKAVSARLEENDGVKGIVRKIK